MPGRHPDDDVLADLAADVLPAGEARAVENHVLSCGRCAGLLEDAERLRGLLLAGDPGPVPADVWQRVEAALAAEGRSQAGAQRGRPDGAAPVADTAAFQAFVDTPTSAIPITPRASGSPRSSDRSGPRWGDESADPLDDPARWDGPRTVRGLRSGARTSGGSRRDTRDARPRRRGPLLLAAAAAVGVIAVVGTVRLAGPGGGSPATMSAGSAESSASDGAGGASTDATIVRTGGSYREATLARQAEGLLALSARGPAAAPGGAGATTKRSQTTRDLAATVDADPKADDVTNPTRLAACLAQLGVAADRLVAVDLATYEGREAAILLLLPVEGGGHEVWAVERTCGPGSEGALHYTRLRD